MVVIKDIIFIKVIFNVLVRGVIVLFRSLVVVLFCKLGLIVGDVVIELDFCW